MRVGQTGSHSVSNSEAGATKQGARTAASQESKKTGKPDSDSASTKETARTPSGANAEISSKAKDLGQAKAIASQAPDVREDKVAELKKRIADGNYRIDSDAIADRLVDDHLRMPGIG